MRVYLRVLIFVLIINYIVYVLTFLLFLFHLEIKSYVVIYVSQQKSLFKDQALQRVEMCGHWLSSR